MTRIVQKRFRYKFLFSSYRRPCIQLNAGVGISNLPFSFPYILKNNKLFCLKQFSRSLLRVLCNTIKGFRYGYFVEIRPEGVGFRFHRCSDAPSTLILTLGHSHPLIVQVPSTVKFRCLKYRLLLYGANKAILNAFALKIRNLRPPDAYKGKGIKFSREILVFKPGKLRQR